MLSSQAYATAGVAGLMKASLGPRREGSSFAAGPSTVSHSMPSMVPAAKEGFK